MNHLDPHQRAPEKIRTVYKKYQKLKLKELDEDEEIIDLTSDISAPSRSKIRVVRELKREDLEPVFRTFAGAECKADGNDVWARIPVYEHEDMPGLHILPSLLPPAIQPILLSRLLHRDLSNPLHQTNIHTHYTLSYPRPITTTTTTTTTSFFSLSPSSPTPIATPLNPSVHKPLPIASLLNKKLRWTTLGGQYDWTAKKYPVDEPPGFPDDVKALLEGCFTQTKAQAAIVNLYSPGDTLSVHRDVAEMSARGLVSVSLGCDAVFVVGGSSGEEEENGKEESVLVLRLKSGSALYMSGKSRFAWHGVPQIVAGTCPDYLRDWPGTAGLDSEYDEWKGWMAGKRVNLNVRQMWG